MYAYLFQLAKLKLYEIPHIDYTQRDPVIESYQNREAESKNQNVVIDQEKTKENFKDNTESQGTTNPNPMQIDDENNEDDAENNDKELIQYTDEELEKMDVDEINYQNYVNVIASEHLKKEKPNLSVLEEFIKRVCYKKKKNFYINYIFYFMYLHICI